MKVQVYSKAYRLHGSMRSNTVVKTMRVQIRPWVGSSTVASQVAVGQRRQIIGDDLGVQEDQVYHWSDCHEVMSLVWEGNASKSFTVHGHGRDTRSQSPVNICGVSEVMAACQGAGGKKVSSQLPHVRSPSVVKMSKVQVH